MESSSKSYITLDRYWQFLRQRWISGLGVFTIVFLFITLAASLTKPLYKAEGKLLLKKTNAISSLTGVGTQIGKLETLQGKDTSPLNTEAEVIRSVSIVQKTINQLGLKDNKGKSLTIDGFIKNLSVKAIEGSDILAVSYRDPEPVRAAVVVNKLMDVYLEHYESLHKKEISVARQFLEKQLPKAETFLQKAEANLAIFREKNNIVSLQDEKQEAVRKITELQSKIGDIKGKIVNNRSQAELISKQLGMDPQQALAITSVSQSAGIQDTLKEIQQLEAQLADKQITFQDNHPEVIYLQGKLSSLKNILQGRIQKLSNSPQIQINSSLQPGQIKQQLTAKLIELESTRLGLVSELAYSSNYEANYQQRLRSIPRLEEKQRQLEGKVQAARSTYSLLLQKLQESRIAENQIVGNASKISEAQIPRSPVLSPKFYYLAGAFVSVLVALAAMYIFEVRDKTIKTLDEAKELMGLTLLGVIPSFSKPKKIIRARKESESFTSRLILRDIPHSPISEAYRMLRANLSFIIADKKLKVIAITSSVSGEGKSTVAANLALTMAQMGTKVLLIDGNLRSPCQHKIWDLDNNEGLSNIILEDSDIAQVITKVADNLNVLTSGTVPSNSASLLDSKRMTALIKSFNDGYEFVIIDAPALTVGADAAILGQMVDGVLILVRPGVVNSVNANITRELLQQSGQNAIGQIVNGVVPQN
ncbi:GumC family protein [Mastigocoleus testarum]|uniref:non-specific protein-tyrosine kinase n=1 Tax=Mastigocoleus testarum BC008 TaxID=371196 RepID=A0A0V7ZH16_9CYAN|nr:polysaccharide biosynthesis tyrosine autokinase [Mastigocoleus testarum]KST63644.1 lipopolysaccharide biosynthesis protein [Mastigocoleus testarum BC008]